jgi:signal transduction histidine kinase
MSPEERVPVIKNSRLWLGASVSMLAVLITAALILPRSFELTAFSDIIQCLLLVSGTAAFIPLASRSRGRIRLFWSLIVLSCGFWLVYQLFWTYTEVLRHRDVPDLCVWDVVLFLHIVPLMAALALRPHVPRDEYAARIGRLDFALLLVWWLYIYVLVVIPWQYVVPDIRAYNQNLNNVYSVEKIVLLAGLIACCLMSKGEWKKLYVGLFGMTLCYSASSALANWAIGRNAYYSGSLYDIPLVTAIAWLTWIALGTKLESAASDARPASTVYGVWVARCSMIAVFSLPLFAAWSLSNPVVPPRIRAFRFGLTLAAAFVMGLMVFVRQHTLDRELIRLLQRSQDSFDNLGRLQAQILQSEKLASVAQLVGGAAHELNNPITAMLGYSDLLLNTPLTSEQQRLASKIRQYVRRTKSLVASLISFARQAPTPKSPVDLNTLARTAVKLTQPLCENSGVEIRTQFASGLPKIIGDSNQLLQVCLQLLANSLHALTEHGGRVLYVSSQPEAGYCVLQILTEPLAALTPGAEQGSSQNGSALGLSACHGILQEHRGRISSENRSDGSVLMRVELPAMDSAPSAAKNSAAPALWQSQPFA